MEVDPDYVGFTVAPQEDLEQEERSKVLQKNAREATVEKIKNIINEQFDKEILMKEEELLRINQKLADARCLMDRLRACVVASFYAASFTKPVDGAKGPEAGAAYHPAIQNVMRKAVTAVMSKNAPYKEQTQKLSITEPKNVTVSDQPDKSNANESGCIQSEENDSVLDTTNKVTEEKPSEAEKIEKRTENLGGRQRIKKTIIVGNVSKYIPSDQREASDKSTHKWMVYVRGSKEEPRIDHFVRKVWFFLHPSYRPNDLVEVCEAPFHLTRRGWGEFPIRVQIHFCDRRNRPVDIIHGLRLDRTYTGLQTLGAETVCEVELDRSSVQLTVDDILKVSTLPHLVPDEPADSSSDRKDENKSLVDAENKSEPVNDDDSPKDAPDLEMEAEAPMEMETTVSDAVAEAVKLPDSDETHQGEKNSAMTSNESSPPRKRKHDESSATDGDSVGSEEKSLEMDTEKLLTEEEPSEEPTPLKRRRKRRRESSRISASEDEVVADNSAAETISAGNSEEQDDKKLGEKSEVAAVQSIDISGTIADVSNKEDIAETSKENCESNSQTELEKSDDQESLSPSSKGSMNDSQSSSGSSDLTSNMKQPIVLLPRSPVPNAGFFRMRSASDGEGIPSISAAKLLKAGISVSSVNVPLNPEQQPSSSSTSTHTSGNPPLKKVTVLSPRSVIFQAKGTSSPPIVLSTMKSLSPKGTDINQEGSKPVMVIKKETSETSPGHITIPLSSLLRTSQSSQPQVVKVAQPSIVSGQTFSVNMPSLASNQGTAQKREKRSFSADNSPAPCVPLTLAGSSSAVQQPIQLHILNTQTVKSLSPKRSKPGSQTVSLQALQAALSSGNITLSQSQTKKDDSQRPSKSASTAPQQQYVLATVVNPKGKQHLALINPSTISLGSSKKVITITSKKVNTPLKLNAAQKKPVGKGTESGVPVQKDRTPVYTKPEPLYKVLGDKIRLCKKVQSFEDDILPALVKLVPLVNEKRDPSQFPFCAKTEEDFLDWNVGKQRASEWQRACLLQKVLKYIQEKSDKLQKHKLPTKKFLMNWCIMHGHSVFTDEYVDDSEVTDEKNVPSDPPTTMTTSEELLKILDQKKSELSKEGGLTVEDDDDVIVIDVVNVDPPSKEVVNVKPEPPEGVVESPETDDAFNERKKRIQAFIESQEVSAVEELTREFGFNLHRMYGMPACHLVLAKALQQFAESLIRKSLSSALERRDGSSIQRVAPEELKVADVVGAIRTTSNFDFLTDCNTACQPLP